MDVATGVGDGDRLPVELVTDVRPKGEFWAGVLFSGLPSPEFLPELEEGSSLPDQLRAVYLLENFLCF